MAHFALGMTVITPGALEAFQRNGECAFQRNRGMKKRKAEEQAR